MKTKLKVRRLWANYYPHPSTPVLHVSAKSAIEGSIMTMTPVPVAVIPIDDIQGIRDRLASAYNALDGDYLPNADCDKLLVAIGVLPKQRKGRK